MSRLTGLLGAALALASLPAKADVFSQLAGEWRGGGEVRGMASEQVMHWGPVLDGAFIRLEFSNTMRSSDGSEFHFRAHGYYRVGKDGNISGTWLDSRGASLPLSGSTPDPFKLRIEWGSQETEQGRTQYRLDGDRLEVVDEMLKSDGAWRVFGRSVLQRVQ